MGWENSFFITEADLGVAYRKAKADLFFERTVPCLQEISEYEENLAENLADLYQNLQSGSLEWLYSSFKDGWTVIPKSISPDGKTDGTTKVEHCLYSDPADLWPSLIAGSENNTPIAKFRLVGNLSIDFHIISALWIMKVGHEYDAKLTDEACGSRLRRCHSDKPEEPGKLNQLSSGTFRPYLTHYKQWREKGLAAMEKGLEDKKRVAAVTADLRLFYHNLCPMFLLDKQYLAEMELDLSTDQKQFTSELIQAIKSWAKQTPLHRNNPDKGLPVGLSASRLIANVALAELDHIILKEIQPLYYGRYVDDIILVLEDSQRFGDAQDIWSYLAKRSRKILKLSGTKPEQELVISITRAYLKGSKLQFMGKKQKAFLLQGDSGKVLVDSIRRQIGEQASEWRRLPELEENDRIATSLIAASGDDGKAVDSLRKTDDLSIRRAGFAIYLRDFEAFEQDLDPADWAPQRKIFFDTVCQHFLSLPKLFNYATYIPRLLGLAASCRDYKAVKQVMDGLDNSFKQIENDCDVVLAGDEATSINILEVWRNNLNQSLFESFLSALSPLHKHDAKEIQPLLCRFKNDLTPKVAFELAKKWCLRDLMRRPFRMRYMPYVHHGECWESDVKTVSAEFMKSSILFNELFANFPQRDDVQDFVEVVLKQEINQPPPMALLFPTRPFSVGEMYMLIFGLEGSISKALEKVPKWMKAFRGFATEERGPSWDDLKGTFVVADQSEKKKVKIGLGCLKTKLRSWKAAVRQYPEPDSSRYRRIYHIVNSTISSRKRPSYLLLPELSIPARWFSRIAAKLGHNGISLIAGVDYLHHPGGKYVANQAWVSLCTDFAGFPMSVIYRQDKEKLAQHEESEIWRISNLRHKIMSPGRTAKPLIRHGDFYFSILICSELTNIDHRARLRGQVDAVFVPEWNQDANSFASLVEASALDIHAFIVQCNDRKYGDSRIRGPYKEAWQRDLVRVKGGIDDFLVIGEIDIKALREFQDDYRSPAKPFKPIPDGYVISPLRVDAAKGVEERK